MKLIIKIASLLVLCFLTISTSIYAGVDIEWKLKKQLNIETAPLDIATSVDGQWIYILVPGEIIVYSAVDEKAAARIPLDKSYDRLTYSITDNTLIVSSAAEKSLKLIKLELVHRFSVEGLNVKGPKNAPVTIAVFSDYQ